MPGPDAPAARRMLERVLSKAGVASRSDAVAWIAAGRVKVNGRVERDPKRWIDPRADRVVLDGRPVGAAPARKVYLLLYKPKGYVTTRRDPAGRKTVFDLLGPGHPYLFTVGRLDLDTSGLLLLTNDTAFADRVASPDHHVPKTYLVKASIFLSDEQMEQLRSGVELKDGVTRPASVARVREAGGKTVFEITITEGRNRQVRRMVEALGGKVLKLVRTRIGDLAIGDLPIGKARPLTDPEVRGLMRARPSGTPPAARRNPP